MATQTKSRLLLECCLIFAGGFLVFFLLRDFAIDGGDTPELLNPLSRKYEVRWGPALSYNARYPLAQLLVQKTYHLTKNLPLSFQIVSCACGAIWLVLLALFGRSREFWLINLLSAVTLLFIGHKEIYAPVAVALTLYCLLLHLALGPAAKVKPWHVVAAWGLAVHAHKLAFFYLPSMIVLFLDPWARQWRPHARREIEKALLTLIAVALLLQIPIWLGIVGWAEPHLVIMDFDNRLLEMLTLPRAWADRVAKRSLSGAYQIFYFGSLDHFKFYVWFWLMGAPVGLVLVALKRRAAMSAELLGLTSCVICSLVWTFLWHPHMGWRDWDLFCIAAIPVNLLAGWLWSRPRDAALARQSLAGSDRLRVRQR